MSPNKGLLKFAMFICLLFALTRLAEFICVRIPPHKAGECFIIPSVSGMTAKILHNFYIDGFSDVEITLSYRMTTIRDTTIATFVEQRQDFGEKTTCQ